VSGQALAFKMRLELAQLARRHRPAPSLTCTLPLAPLSDRSVRITGIASSPTIDQDRMLFRSHSLTFLPWKPPPLLYRHREPAGEIETIEYDSRGRLIISARVDHAEARRCNGLSVAATIKAYELRDQDDPKAFHAVILAADLDEVSLTPTPACADCVVTSRMPASPNGEFYDTARRGIEQCMLIVEQMQKILATPAPSRAERPPRAERHIRPAIPTVPHRVGQFGQLVRRLEEQHPL
jgi:hypothetical protein